MSERERERASDASPPICALSNGVHSIIGFGGMREVTPQFRVVVARKRAGAFPTPPCDVTWECPINWERAGRCNKDPLGSMLGRRRCQFPDARCLYPRGAH